VTVDSVTSLLRVCGIFVTVLCVVCVCRVRNDEVLLRTGLTSLSRLLSRRRISVFGHVARLDDDTPANNGSSAPHQRITQTDLLTAHGVAHLVVHGTSGLTSYETIPPVPLETSGGVLSTVCEAIICPCLKNYGALMYEKPLSIDKGFANCIRP